MATIAYFKPQGCFELSLPVASPDARTKPILEVVRPAMVYAYSQDIIILEQIVSSVPNGKWVFTGISVNNPEQIILRVAVEVINDHEYMVTVYRPQKNTYTLTLCQKQSVVDLLTLLLD